MAELALTLAMLGFAGLLRGFTGFGFAIAATPLLSLLHPPLEVVPVVLLLQLGISLQGLPNAWKVADRSSLARLAIGAGLATPLGLWALTVLPPAPVRLVIAGLVLLTVAVLGGGFRLARTPRGPVVLGFGVLAGLCNGLAAMPGPPVIAMYLASPLRAEAARGAMILLFMLTAMAGLLPLLLLGQVGRHSLVLALAGLPVVWGASALGAWAYRRSPEARFRRIALGVLATAGLAAAIRVFIP
jgi:uncharacterized membrane protein YfcA